MIIDPGTATIIGAVLAASAVLVAALIAKGKKAEGAKKSAEGVVKGTRELMSDRRAQEVHSKSEILNLDGDSKNTTQWVGIKLRDGVSLMHISGRIFTATPGSSIKSVPKLNSSKSFPKNVSLQITKNLPTDCEYNVEITGFLTPNDPPLGYEIEAELSKAVLMDRESVEAAYANDQIKSDYHAFDVEFVIDLLTIEVVFPENFPVTAFATVSSGRSENINDAEYQRVKSGFERTDRGGRFVIKDPLLSCRYLIYWTVPPKAALPPRQAATTTATATTNTSSSTPSASTTP